MDSTTILLSMLRRRFAAASLALGLAAAACGGSAEVETGTAPVDDAAAETAAPEPIMISAPTADGGTIDFADLAGQDLMLWFWAPW